MIPNYGWSGIGICAFGNFDSALSGVYSTAASASLFSSFCGGETALKWNRTANGAPPRGTIPVFSQRKSRCRREAQVWFKNTPSTCIIWQVWYCVCVACEPVESYVPSNRAQEASSYVSPLGASGLLCSVSIWVPSAPLRTSMLICRSIFAVHSLLCFLTMSIVVYIHDSVYRFATIGTQTAFVLFKFSSIRHRVTSMRRQYCQHLWCGWTDCGSGCWSSENARDLQCFWTFELCYSFWVWSFNYGFGRRESW